MVNKNILKIRKQLDKLDNNLLILIKKRTQLVNIVLKNKGWEFGEAVFTRRFDLDGKGSKNVMTEEVVEEIANSLGLNGKEAATAHSSGEFDEIQDKYIQYGEEDGVFGFPFFSYVPADGRPKETYWGNDRIEYILKTVLNIDYVPSIPKDTLVEIQRSRL